ncbi:MAG: hypothetical protein A2289_17925 [Deltaproteobacteria bacterium RIFOXYA12_FULL_58_15]|nr:MAG: hypothetical protein A2289_17925 [Deltaproteobacteria bacterium RIFOXYA12_FULL_58_15]OGR09056.1 MAG: hypothetical protein A2341_25835 [Deltaproteobacteria bacterium RIFOXYB12_FULL_58_9]
MQRLHPPLELSTCHGGVDNTTVFVLAPQENHKECRQWNYLLGIVRTQGERLDLAYARRWAKALNIENLLKRLLESN